MSDKQSDLTDKEIEDLQNIVTDTLASVCAMADKHNIDRDSMLKYFADMLTAFTEVASIQNYEANHTCNCQHNSDSRDSESYCRCDSMKTNADRIRNMSDEELAELIIGGLNFDCSDYCDSFSAGCAFRCNGKEKELELALKWLQSEAE